jgi:hypothetical protein
MDDQAAVIARRVAMAAAAWFDAPANIDAYRRKTPVPPNCSASWRTQPAHHRNPSESVWSTWKLC